MTRFLTYLFLALAVLAGAARAESDDSSMLERFLQDTLSGENRFIRVYGLDGAFSSRATIDKLTIADDDGVWLTMTGAVLDWNRMKLVRGRFSVNTLGAEEIVIAREPGKATTPGKLPSPEAQPFALPELPVSIEIGEIKVGRVVLEEQVFGVAARLALDGSVMLADGKLDTTLSAARIDRPGDAAGLTARFDNETRNIGLDLSVVEDAGGVISAALRMPDRPSLSLVAGGEGPVEDFTADIALASDGTDRVTGQVRLRKEPATGTTGADGQGIAFEARVAGDVTPFLPQDYREFFGTDSRLEVAGVRAGDGRLDLPVLSVVSEALHLRGALAVAADGRVELVDLDGGVVPPDGGRVVLPLTGPKTSVVGADFAARLDRAAGDGWELDLDVDRLSRPGIEIARLNLSGEGTVGEGPDTRIGGGFSGTLTGIAADDPALAAAVGGTLALDGRFRLTLDNILHLEGVNLLGADYRANVTGLVRGLASGFEMDGTAQVGAADLSRFSGLAGRPLGGAVTARVTGSGAPLSGSFDIVLDARSRDLKTGIDRLDPLTAGAATLRLDAARGPSGIDIRGFRIDGEALSANAEGHLSSGDSRLKLDARLSDLSLATPRLQGPLTLAADLSRTGPVWAGGIRVDGPHGSRASLTGTASPEGKAEMRFDAELARLERFVPDLAGSLTTTGTATRDAGGLWEVDGEATGPAGVAAQVSGTLDEVSGLVDMAASGQVRLNIVNLFISPNSIDGTARFDLAMNGAPSLDALSGTITTSGATAAIPSVLQTVKDIDARLTLGATGAEIAASGTLGAGGSFRIGGPVALAAPFDSRLTVDLLALGVTDNLSFTTSANGRVVYAGPLAGNGALSGRIDFGDSDINLNTVGGSAGAAPIPPVSHRDEPAPVYATRDRAGLVETGSAAGGGPVIALDLVLAANNRVYVDGFGLQAEMGGEIAIRGTTANVAPAGQIALIRGTLDIIGRKLKLTKGVITMQGDLRPYVEFQSATSTSEGTATIEISGPINAPEVRVYAEPERPAEEALAILLFGNRYSELSPLVIAQMAASLARMRSSGGDVAGDVKDATGIDTVNVGTDESGAGSLRAGGYLSENVYTDFTVNTEGETELNLNLDLNESLTVKGTVDNSGNTALGLFFERDY